MDDILYPRFSIQHLEIYFFFSPNRPRFPFAEVFHPWGDDEADLLRCSLSYRKGNVSTQYLKTTIFAVTKSETRIEQNGMVCGRGAGFSGIQELERALVLVEAIINSLGQFQL